MAKSFDDYINELKEFQKRSKNYTAANSSNLQNPVPSAYRGRIIFNITHSRGTYPVENALITIFDNGNIIKAVTTDESGKSPTITLDAFDKKFSESPSSDINNITRYYDAQIEAEDFVTVRIENIPIYENVTTLQQYDMLFKSAANGQEIQIITLPNNRTV